MARLTDKTPKFFRIIRNVGAILAALGLTLVSAPVALPAAAATVGGYLIFGGSIAAAISQSAKPGE